MAYQTSWHLDNLEESNPCAARLFIGSGKRLNANFKGKSCKEESARVIEPFKDDNWQYITNKL